MQEVKISFSKRLIFFPFKEFLDFMRQIWVSTLTSITERSSFEHPELFFKWPLGRNFVVDRENVWIESRRYQSPYYDWVYEKSWVVMVRERKHPASSIPRHVSSNILNIFSREAMLMHFDFILNSNLLNIKLISNRFECNQTDSGYGVSSNALPHEISISKNLIRKTHDREFIPTDLPETVWIERSPADLEVNPNFSEFGKVLDPSQKIYVIFLIKTLCFRWNFDLLHCLRALITCYRYLTKVPILKKFAARPSAARRIFLF